MNTAGNRLAATTKYLRGAAGIGLGTKIKVVPLFLGPAKYSAHKPLYLTPIEK
jgi:hypothetical protein